MRMRLGCRFMLMSLMAGIALLCPLARVRAEDTEYRDYSIFIDGKDSGSSKMKIVQQDDGTTYMSATLDVKFRQFIAEYNLKVETKEWWKEGRLIGMETTSAENRKKTDVVVAVSKDQLRIRVNGQERYLRPETWTTSFWKLADARFHNKQIPVLEVDTGKDFNCELKYLDAQQLKVGSQLQDCYHFRVTGGPSPVELWYDRYHRLVRQESTEMGHRTIVQLVQVRR
jgi:hypothetical protein